MLRMVKILAALVIALTVTAGVRSANEVTCRHLILCPCGNTGKYVKVCAEGENPCVRWSRCKTCKDGLDGCLECPEGTAGLSCLKVPEILSRQRRQYQIGRNSTRDNRRTAISPIRNQRQVSLTTLIAVCKATEFRCRNGECIDKNWRCDSDTDCDDDSDEGDFCKPEIGICSHLGRVTNGYKTKVFNPDGSNGGPRKLISLSYFCDQGYYLEGNKTIDCRASLREPYETPGCVKVNEVPSVFCVNPGPISNGKVEYVPRPNSRVAVPQDSNGEYIEYPQGSHLEYSCNAGYALDGESELTCKETGLWSADPPICVTPRSGIIDSACVSPGSIANGKIKYVQLPGGRIYRPPANNRGITAYSKGTRLIFSCNRGYTLDTMSEITCLEGGRWSEDPPICLTSDLTRRIECRNPGPLVNGKYNYSSRFEVGEKASIWLPEGLKITYRCNEDYKLDGKDTLTCQSTGEWTAVPPECKLKDCGRTEAGVNPKILHGSKVKAGEWPWVVAIAVLEYNLPVIICGGAVLNHQTVITAAHCLDRNEEYILYFGKLYRDNTRDDDQVQVARSRRLIFYPQYNNVTYDSDIALIKVDPIKLSGRVQPICLPTGRTTSINLKPGQKGYVSGWGLNEKQVYSEELMMANLPVQKDEDCIESFRINSNVAVNITHNMFCAGFPEAQQSTCTADSGSPFVFYNHFTHQHTIEGIVSFTVEGECGRPGIFSVYTKVHPFLPWIFKNMEEIR